jgi:hypothetical protein
MEDNRFMFSKTEFPGNAAYEEWWYVHATDRASGLKFFINLSIVKYRFIKSADVVVHVETPDGVVKTTGNQGLYPFLKTSTKEFNVNLLNGISMKALGNNKFELKGKDVYTKTRFDLVLRCKGRHTRLKALGTMIMNGGKFHQFDGSRGYRVHRKRSVFQLHAFRMIPCS